jgi:hypothetical protein
VLLVPPEGQGRLRAAGASCAALLAALLFTAACPAPARAALPSRVSYLAGGTVYIEAGRDDGLIEGDTLSVARGDSLLAKLRVTFLSSHRAACDTLFVAGALKPGDTVNFVAHSGTTPVAAAPTAVAAPDSLNGVSPVVPLAATARHDNSLLHGRIGARLLTVRDHSGIGGGFTQPALDVRLDGANMGGGPADLSVDARTRRTSSTLADGTTGSVATTRVYRASMSFHDPASRYRLTIGRQSSPTLASVSIFDGALAELTRPRWSGGLFSGSQPDVTTDGFSRSVVEHGAYLEWHAPPLAEHRWSTTLGGVTSYQDGQYNRDFVFAQGYYQAPSLSATFAQEIDLNHGWKIAAGEQSVSPTSTFLFARTQLTKVWAMNAGYDNRRNVRLLSDQATPATEFDDRYHSGGWVGTSLGLGRHFQLDGDARVRGGTAIDRSHGWSAGGEVFGLRVWNARLRGHYSSYVSETQDSRLTTLGLGLDPHPLVHFEASGGLRESRDLTFATLESVHWFEGDLDVALARRWYVNGCVEVDRGGAVDFTQTYTGLSWRL